VTRGHPRDPDRRIRFVNSKQSAWLSVNVVHDPPKHQEKLD
jgi:hypothetical protein